MVRLLAAILAAWILSGCAASSLPVPVAERELAIPAERRRSLELDLVQAREAFERQPRSEERIIWLGRRLAYLGRFNEAIAVFTDGLRTHPKSYRLLRHRGHRYITTRQFDRAVTDLSRAAELISGVPDEIEPDGAPNARNIPRSTTNSNIYYHLGLAHYLKGDFARAAAAFRRCMEFSQVNDDMLVATANWLYQSLRRAGRESEAAAVLEPIRSEMDVIENHSYHRLLLMYRGETRTDELLKGMGQNAIDDSTMGYALGSWHLANGDTTAAREVWGHVLKGENWAAFGFIAAEADIARVGG
jgi:tetratricopeptide (TPR) repeat protein